MAQTVTATTNPDPVLTKASLSIAFASADQSSADSSPDSPSQAQASGYI